MSDENLFLLYAFYTGVYVTFLYDLIRIFRRTVGHGKVMVAIEDLVFWIYCTAKVFLLMYRFSDGMLRWFAVAGAVGGMFLYRKIISAPFVKYTTMVFLKMKRLLGRISGWLMRPVAKFLFYLKKKLTILLKLIKMSL